MRKRRKQMIALLCALVLCCGNDIMRVRADVPEEVMLEASEEMTPETTEEMTPETAEEVMPETTEEVMPETTEEVMPETTEEVMPETVETDASENDVSVTESGEGSAAEAPEAEDELPESPASIVENRRINLRDGTKTGISMLALRSISFQNCFGDQLDELSKEIYDVMVENYVTNRQTGNIVAFFDTPITFTAEIKDNKIVENEAYTEVCTKIKEAFGKAYEGLMKDYPQVFWMSSLNIQYGVTVNGSTATIVGYTLEPVEYAEKYSEKIDEFNSGVAEAKNAVKAKLSESASAYDTLKAIHDYLCEELEYNYDALSGDSAYQYAHNVYTAFAGNKKVVCEGYAKAFKILCNEFGISCILATGDGVTSSGTEAHMWNCVKMVDGKWYAVDVTWDDQSTVYYNHFLAGNNTEGFNGHSFSDEHRLDTSFVYPELAEENYVQCDHEWNVVEEETDATCTEEGSKTTKEVCKKCQSVKPGSEKTEIMEALGHNYRETTTKAATCMEEGCKTKTCMRCDDTVTETIPKTEHSYGEWEVVKEATCMQTGERRRVCQIGGETETETVPVIAHVYEEKVVTKEAGCMEEGSRTTTEVCTQCQSVKPGSEKTEIVEALGHHYDKWTLKQIATDAGNGVMERRCTVCGEAQTEEIAADGTPVSKELKAYHVIEGGNSTWKVGSSADIRIRVDGEYEKFQSVWVDGVLIGSGDYTAEKGSTIINLKTSYLETLPKGSHVITILYEDGQAGTAFSVNESTAVAGDSPGSDKTDSVNESTAVAGDSPGSDKTDSGIAKQSTADSRTEAAHVQTTAPKTGDTTSLWLYAVMLFAGFACIKMFWGKYVDEKYGDEE